MKKSLVTGGAGFIGFHLARYLEHSGRHVTIVDNLSRGRMDDELRQLLESKNVEFVRCDMSKHDEAAGLGSGFDEVYHLAAINGTRNFYEMPETVLRVNVLGAINILDWFAGSKSRKILFTSSSETYAGTLTKFGVPIPTPEDVPLSIEDEFNPRWSYGASKIIGEMFFINYSRKHGFPASIVRYHNIYGPRMGGDHVIPEFCARIFRKEDPFTINGGSQTRAFCYVDDAVRATEMVMSSSETDGKIINIGLEEETMILDLAKKMLAIEGFGPEIAVKPAPDGSVQRRCPDTTKLRAIGFRAAISLDEGLRKTMDWYRRRGG